MHSAPTIMVSSTFYDLHHLRSHLFEFISKDLGYIPLLSEFPSFPVDPDLDTIENCRRRVNENADILVLIIGGRYGSIDTTSNKSITNLEFSTAKAKGIPIYAFVDKSVLSILPVWKENPDANFSKSVDTPRLFEFIERVRSGERVWTFPFETPHDIVTTLRLQLAYLARDSLKARQLFSGSGIPSYMETLRPKALRAALEKPEAWEYILFLQTWSDEVDRRENLIREYRVGLKLDNVINVPAEDAATWFLTKMEELSNFVDSMTTLINVSLQEALGPEGVAGNAQQIVWVTQMIGRLLDQVLRWAISVRCSRQEGPFSRVAAELSKMADDVVNQIIQKPEDALRQLTEALALPRSDERRQFDITLTINIANEEGFYQAMAEARRFYGLD